MPPIYLDYNATTPIDPAVLEAMLPYLRTEFGNPSSTHAYGRTAQAAVERARQQVAALLNAHADEIVFTGGGSEASNHAIKGTAWPRLASAVGSRAPHVVISAIEHPATAEPCAFLRRLGCTLSVVPVDGFGRVDPDAVVRSLTSQTVLVSIMHSNNEVGTLQPIKEIAAQARARGILMHTDAAQSLGKVDVDVNDLGVDLLTVAGHKLYAPKGHRRPVHSPRRDVGASHPWGRARRRSPRRHRECALHRRPGPGLRAGADFALDGHATAARLRDRLWTALRTALGDRVVLNGHAEQRLPNTLNVNFVGHIGSELLQKVPEVAASTGSACHEGMVKLSPVLAAMGVPPELGKGALRLTVGRFTTDDEVDQAAALLSAAAR